MTRFCACALIGTIAFLSTAATAETGSIKGHVIDRDTQAPLPGVNVLVVGSRFGAATDTAGSFELRYVPVGSYILQFTSVGYEQMRKTDVIVRSSRVTAVEAMMTSRLLESAEVQATAGYFRESEMQPLSTMSFSFEEIRRAPGAVGDVSRSMSALPSVAKTNDQYNSLLVRGGTVLENGFYLDGIEIPNVNHFPSQGSTGGAIGALNVDLVQDVRFSSGGFSAEYGDRLSSVMDVTLRDGNREAIDTQLELGMAGAGIEADGPLAAGMGSWMVSARHSYTDLISRIAGFGTSPTYSDAQFKVVYDITPDHRITALDFFSFDRNHIPEDQGTDSDIQIYGSDDDLANSTGLVWRWLWGKSGYSTTSLSHTFQSYAIDYREIGTRGRLIDNNSNDQSFRLRSETHLLVSPRMQVTLGADAQVLTARYNIVFGELTNALGQTTDEAVVDQRSTCTKGAFFLNATVRPVERLEASLGLRADRFSVQGRFLFSPRLSVMYRASEQTSLYASAGLYRQTLPMLLLLSNDANRNIDNPRAVHFIVGASHLLAEDTRLTFEAYTKEYRAMPMDPIQPSLFILDEFTTRYGFYVNHAPLVPAGTANARGVELILQKKLAVDFYGIVGASLSANRYRGLDGVWRNRASDNRVSFSIEGGYKPSSDWEFSLRWLYAGGVPTTPFDIGQSQRVHRGVYDETRVNGERLADYHSLNLRADRRFYFEKTNLILYLSIWNAYNRKNVSAYFWNARLNEPGIQYQWSLLPILGVEYEF